TRSSAISTSRRIGQHKISRTDGHTGDDTNNAREFFANNHTNTPSGDLGLHLSGRPALDLAGPVLPPGPHPRRPGQLEAARPRLDSAARSRSAAKLGLLASPLLPDRVPRLRPGAQMPMVAAFPRGRAPVAHTEGGADRPPARPRARREGRRPTR